MAASRIAVVLRRLGSSFRIKSLTAGARWHVRRQGTSTRMLPGSRTLKVVPLAPVAIASVPPS